jgi:hypothetical protein
MEAEFWIFSDSHGELLRSNSADFPPRRGLLGRSARLGRGFGFGFPFAHRVGYTGIVRGVNNTTGNGLVEVYALP